MHNSLSSGRASDIRSVGAITAFFLVVLITVTGLMSYVIYSMTASANKIDDARATRAAITAVSALKSKLAATLEDNALWDEAYGAVNADTAEAWISENWGTTSSDYSLYDGVVVLDGNGRHPQAYLKGKPFDPLRYFGPEFTVRVKVASTPGQKPTMSFMETPGGLALVGMQAIQPFTPEGPVSDLKVLVYFKHMTPALLKAVAVEHGLTDLSLQQNPDKDYLQLALTDPVGHIVNYLTWYSDRPGTIVLRQVMPCILAAAGLLSLFMIAVIYAGRSEKNRLQRAADASWYLATHDALSGLLNRSGFFDALEQTQRNLSEGEQLIVFLMDLDGFKAVNDTWGHPVGDQLISTVAETLRTCHDEILFTARLGGDEFAIVTRNAGIGRHLAETILEVFNLPFEIEGRSIEVGISIGLTSGDRTVTPVELLRQADLALYNAKESGKGRAVSFQVELDAERKREAELEAELRRAIETGSIFPVFQPLFAADTRLVSGVEALARWIRPEGAVSPEIFIPLAEKCGLIDTLGAKLLEEAIRNARNWPGYNLSVNVSPLQLCNPGFSTQVRKILEKQAFDPNRLTLEVTESVLISNPDQARRSIEALKQIGVTFALDDFGCGYASIGVLRQFGFDRIKIDRSLVSAAEADERGLGILRATVALARALKLPVTAEGIENVFQANMLEAAGCDQLQGYLLGRPIPAALIDAGVRRDASQADRNIA